MKDSVAAENPGLAVETLFNDSSIQRIIDRYTKELNISLSTTGKTTGILHILHTFLGKEFLQFGRLIEVVTSVPLIEMFASIAAK